MNDRSISLPPGNYGSIILRDRASITLHAGIYNVKQFIIGDDARLVLNFSSGSGIRVNAASDMRFLDRVRVSFSDDHNTESVQFYSGGTSTVQVGYESDFYGNITAPNAPVVVYGRSHFVGTVKAKSIEFQSNINFGSGMLPPEVVIVTPQNGFITNQSPIEVVWTVDGVVQTTETSAILVEGENIVTRSYTDAAGNTGTASVVVTLDTQVPVVTIQSPANGHLTNQSDVTVAWAVDGVAQTTETTATLVEGDNTITRTATDAAGNTGTASVVVTLDTQAPVVAIQSPANGHFTNQSEVSVSWTVDGVAQTTETTATLVEGDNTITRTATDAAGNTGTASVVVTLDTQAPVVAIQSPADGYITNQN